MERADIVIVGGGLAGAAVAENYRKSGGAERVLLLSRDPDYPVHRPPLSKEYLRGDESRDKVFVHPPGFYDENGIEVRLETGVRSMDLTAKSLTLDNGDLVAFGRLVLATGSRPRRLPLEGADLDGVFVLRTLRSADALGRAAASARQAVIIGAGFIGMEVAASLTQRGIHCTVVDVGPRMWANLVPEVVSTSIEAYYHQRGVDFRFGAGIKEIQGQTRAESLVLATGERLPADLIVIGVGAQLNTELAEQAGLPVDQGVVVDEYLRTVHPDVFAVGDIASFPDPVVGRTHLEHWDNALQQGRAVASALAGTLTPFDHVAYFFSDLFDLSLNMIGYPGGWDDIVVRGTPSDTRFTTIYLREGVIRAALMVNDDEYFDAWAPLIRERRAIESFREALADPSVDPASLAGSPAEVG